MTLQRILRVTQSPMNAERWCFDLVCGHEAWVTSKRRPQTMRTWRNSEGEKMISPRSMPCPKCKSEP
jgi:hypothetical protein